MCALFAAAARRRRSSAGRRPDGSTSRSNLASNAVRAGRVPSFGSSRDHRDSAASRARSERCAAVSGSDLFDMEPGSTNRSRYLSRRRSRSL